jgi:aminoglycoside 6'-N-acetyltransferase I
MIEELTLKNLKDLIVLVLELWTDCKFEEEYEYYKTLIHSDKEVCYLVKKENEYIAFIHLAVRNDYVEGVDELPVAYLEGIYVKANFQNRKIAKSLIDKAVEWTKQRGLKQIASDTSLTNATSIEFHKKVGFKEVERIVCFIKDL